MPPRILSFLSLIFVIPPLAGAATVVLQQGKTMREHKAPGEITVQCLEGRLAFITPQATHELEPGDFLHLEAGVPHALQALTDTSALVTMVVVHPGT